MKASGKLRASAFPQAYNARGRDVTQRGRTHAHICVHARVGSSKARCEVRAPVQDVRVGAESREKCGVFPVDCVTPMTSRHNNCLVIDGNTERDNRDKGQPAV